VTSQTRLAHTAGFLHHGQSRRRAAAVNMPGSQTCRPGLTEASTGTPSKVEEPRYQPQDQQPVYTDTLTSSTPGVKSRHSEHEVARPRGGGTGSSTLPNPALSDQGPGFARPCGVCPRFAAGPRRLVLLRYAKFRIHSLRLSSAKVGDLLLLGDARALRHLSASKRGDPTAGQLVTLTPDI
jgi:hypothetical protein